LTIGDRGAEENSINEKDSFTFSVKNKRNQYTDKIWRAIVKMKKK